MGSSRLSVKKTPGTPESKEVLAEAITKISEAMRELTASGLNRDAIVVLLAAKTGVSKRDINTVLDGLNRLRGWYCR